VLGCTHDIRRKDTDVKITITPVPEEFEMEDSFEEFIADNFAVGTRVSVTADGVLWYGTVTEIEQPCPPTEKDVATCRDAGFCDGDVHVSWCPLNNDPNED
jgi:hypothetical protein